MSEQARKVFNIEEQKAKDVMAAIRVVQPVLSLIREWGKVTKEYTQLKEDNEKLSKEISSIMHVNGLTCKGLDLEKCLSEMLKTKSVEYEASLKKEKEVKSICDDLEKEVLLYQEYAKSFNWIDKSIIEKLLYLNKFEDKEEYLSMMFLFLNADISNYNLGPLKWSMFNDKCYYISLNLGWNWMFDKLRLNEI